MGPVWYILLLTVGTKSNYYCHKFANFNEEIFFKDYKHKYKVPHQTKVYGVLCMVGAVTQSENLNFRNSNNQKTRFS